VDTSTVRDRTGYLPGVAWMYPRPPALEPSFDGHYSASAEVREPVAFTPAKVGHLTRKGPQP